jgi:tRNA(Arg) A34 adenosine deaminase TadA
MSDIPPTDTISTLEAEAYVAALNRDIQVYCQFHPLNDDVARERFMEQLLTWAGKAAYESAARLEGGPFGAMLVDFHRLLPFPKVVGFGANHVVPNSDPSAHAEVTAIHDAAKRLGHTDFSGLTLVTSCECCPMCLSAITACRVEKIYFAATRQDAAHAGFSDEDQYQLMTSGGIERHARKASDTAEAHQLLGGHDAVVVVRHRDKPYLYYGDYVASDPLDPTDLPVVQAIRRATKGLAALRRRASGDVQPVFHLPEDTLLISKDIPHPLSLATADWARIGRVRGAHVDNPAEDKSGKDTSRILYLGDRSELMQVRNTLGQAHTVAVQAIWQEIATPSAIHLDKNLGQTRNIAFEKWQELLDSSSVPKY